MNVGSLEIQMAMDLARLRQDLSSVKKDVGDAMSVVNGAVDIAKKAFIGFVGVATIDAFKSMVMGAIDAAGALKDVAQQTGNSAAALAQFKSIGAYSETSLDAIAGASLKLSKNLALTDEEGKGAALALKAMGIDFDTFTKMNPDQRMLTLAKSFSQYKDGADKSAAATLLMGKEGAKMLPFLADLAEQSDQVTAKLSEQDIATRALQASMADAFGDNLTKIRKESDGWKKDLSLGLLPALYEASEAVLQMNNGTGGLKAQISALAKDGTLAEWARGAMTALSYVVDVGQALFSLIPMIGKVISGVAAGSVELFTNMGDAVSKVLKGDFSGAVDSMKNGFRSVATIGEDTANEVSKLWNQKLIGETFRDTMAGLKGVQAEGKQAQKDLNLSEALKANEAAKKAEAAATKAAAAEQKKLQAAWEAAEKAGEDLRNGIDAKNVALQEEIDLGRKLTPVEQTLIKLTKDLASGKVTMSKADEDATRAAIEHGEALERDVAWMRQANKENLASVDATDKRIESLRDETEKQRIANAEFGKSAEELAKLRQARLLDLAASADSKASLLDLVDWTGKLGDQQRELAQAYRDAATVAGQGVAVKAAKDAQDAWQKTIDSVGQGLTDSLFRAFEAGKGFWSTLWDGIVNTLKTTALKVVIQGVDGKGGIVGSLMNMIGLGSGAGSGGSGAGAGGFTSAISSLTGIFSSLASSWGSFSSAFAGGSQLGMSAFSGGWTAATSGNLAMGSGQMLGSLSSMAGPFAAILAGMLGSNYAFSKGYSQDNLPLAARVLFPEHKLDTDILAKIVGDKTANIISGAALTSMIFNWGGGTPQRGGSWLSDGTDGHAVNGGASGLDRAWGDSIGKYFSQDVQDVLKVMTTGSAGMLNDLSKLFGGAGGYQVGAFFASDNNRDSQGNRAILKDGKVLSSWSGSGLDSDPTTGLQQLGDALAGQLRDVMGQINLPQWAKKQLDALGTGVTMDKLAEVVGGIQQAQAAIKAVGESFAPLGGVFTQIAGLSSDATMQLAQFAGGIDALMAQASSFVENYYSDDQKQAIQASQIIKALNDAGLAAAGGALSSKDDFRALVESTDVQTEEGRKQFAALLALNESFAPVGEYLKQQGLTLAQLADQAPQIAALQAINDSSTSSTAIQQQASDRLVQLDDTFNTVGADLGAKLQSLTESVDAGLAAVAANTAEMNRRFARWDGVDGMNTLAA